MEASNVSNALILFQLSLLLDSEGALHISIADRAASGSHTLRFAIHGLFFAAFRAKRASSFCTLCAAVQEATNAQSGRCPGYGYSWVAGIGLPQEAQAFFSAFTIGSPSWLRTSYLVWLLSPDVFDIDETVWTLCGLHVLRKKDPLPRRRSSRLSFRE